MGNHLACQGHITGGNYLMIVSVVSDVVIDGAFLFFGVFLALSPLDFLSALVINGSLHLTSLWIFSWNVPQMAFLLFEAFSLAEYSPQFLPFS